MASGYSPKDIVLDGLAPISGVVTNQAISKDTGISWDSAFRLRVDVVASGVTVVGAVTAKLQHRPPNTSTWIDLAGANATVAITAAGVFSITQLVERTADQANMPIRKQIRVVLTTTNAGDAATIGSIYLYQAL